MKNATYRFIIFKMIGICKTEGAAPGVEPRLGGAYGGAVTVLF